MSHTGENQPDWGYYDKGGLLPPSPPPGQPLRGSRGGRGWGSPGGPGPRGWTMRGGGASSYVEAAPEWRGTSVQVCGLWPFIAGSGTPMVGVPIGRHLFTHATVCSDPVSWFTRAKLISNPGVVVLGLTGRGKSSLVRRMATGLAAYGVLPVVFGDTKPDYVDLIRALGGSIVRLGRGEGKLNVLDPGAATAFRSQAHWPRQGKTPGRRGRPAPERRLGPH